MFRVPALRAAIDRLMEATEEVTELFGRIITEYQMEISRQQEILFTVINSHGAVIPPLLRREEDAPEQREWRPSLMSPRIKEEQEEVLISPERSGSASGDTHLMVMKKKEDTPGQQEGKTNLVLSHIKKVPEEVLICQSNRLDKDVLTNFTFTTVPLEPEEDDETEKHRCLQLQYTEEMESEADGEDCGGKELKNKFNPGYCLKQHSHGEWRETNETKSGFKPLRNREEPLWDTERKTVSSSKSATNDDHKRHVQNQRGDQTEAKPFTCTVCDRKYTRRATLTAHMRTHSEGKGFSCSVCNKNFPFRAHLVAHMRTHTGEKPFSCSVCSKGFGERGNLKQHMRTHTGEKPFSCSVCGKGFAKGGNLRDHMKIHTGEKLFICSLCGKGFVHSGHLKQHQAIHKR